MSIEGFKNSEGCEGTVSDDDSGSIEGRRKSWKVEH